MSKYFKFTKNDYVNAKNDDSLFNKVYNSYLGLIKKLKKEYLSKYSVEEKIISQALKDGLVGAIMGYEEKNEEFSNYAYKCMVLSVKKTLNIKTDDKNTNLDDPTYSFESKPSNSLIINIINKSLDPTIINSKDINLKNLLTYLTNQEKRVFYYLFKGNSKDEIANIMQLTKTNINEIIKSASDKLSKIILISKKTYSLIQQGYDFKEIKKHTNLSSPHEIIYFSNIYSFIFLDGRRPIDEPKLLNKIIVETENIHLK